MFCLTFLNQEHRNITGDIMAPKSDGIKIIRKIALVTITVVFISFDLFIGFPIEKRTLIWINQKLW